MEQIVIYFSMVQRLLNLKQKILRLFHIHYVLEIYQKIGQMIIWKKRFNSYVYDFSTNYNVIATSGIEDIHKYLMKKVI